MHISKPVTHKNIAIFYLHQDIDVTPVPLTLDEALQSEQIEVKETGDIGELTIRNIGDQDVFIQSGDIVKGGLQDRIIKVSTILKPRAEAIPLETLCVESGRWGGRSRESTTAFSRSRTSAHKRMKMYAMASAKASSPRQRGMATMASRDEDQSYMWEEVSSSQKKMAAAMQRSVADAQSPSSYELYRNHEAVLENQNAYVDALKSSGMGGPNAIGIIFALDGELHNGEVYESHGLFEKMWHKNVHAVINEALASVDNADDASTPNEQEVQKFLKKAEAGDATEAELPSGGWLRSCTADDAMLVEAQRDSRAWVHRHYATA